MHGLGSPSPAPMPPGLPVLAPSTPGVDAGKGRLSLSRAALRAGWRRLWQRLVVGGLVLACVSWSARLTVERQVLADPIQLALAAAGLEAERSRVLLWSERAEPLITFGALKQAAGEVVQGVAPASSQLRLESAAGDLYRAVRYTGMAGETPVEVTALTLLPAGRDGHPRSVVSVSLGPAPGYSGLARLAAAFGRVLRTRVAPPRQALHLQAVEAPAVPRPAATGPGGAEAAEPEGLSGGGTATGGDGWLPLSTVARQRLALERMLRALDGRVVDREGEALVTVYTPRLPGARNSQARGNLSLRFGARGDQLSVELGVPSLGDAIQQLLYNQASSGDPPSRG